MLANPETLEHSRTFYNDVVVQCGKAVCIALPLYLCGLTDYFQSHKN
jgi:hypothetical protein